MPSRASPGGDRHQFYRRADVVHPGAELLAAIHRGVGSNAAALGRKQRDKVGSVAPPNIGGIGQFLKLFFGKSAGRFEQPEVRNCPSMINKNERFCDQWERSWMVSSGGNGFRA